MELYEHTLLPEYERWKDKIASYFDSSPYLLFSPSDLGSPLQDKLLVFYDIPLKEPASEGFDPVQLDTDNAYVTTLQVPRSTDWKQLQVWLSIHQYLDSEFGLALVDSEDQVQEWIKKREHSFEFRRFRVPEITSTGVVDPAPSFPVIRLTSLRSGLNPYWYKNLK